MTLRTQLTRFIPAMDWLLHYDRANLADDITAGIITAVLLIPQGMAYALLAGLPPEMGLYASIVPPVIYALLGSSRPLSVGPVSVAALLVANALGASGIAPGDPAYLADALLLAAMTGAILLIMAAMRLGTLVNFLSHPVLSGFTSGAAVLIILSQLPNLTGMPKFDTHDGLPDAAVLQAVEPTTAALGIGAVIVLLLMKTPLIRLLRFMGMSTHASGLASRAGPLALIAIMAVLVWGLDLNRLGVDIVGHIPSGLPTLTLDFLDLARARELLPAAMLIALIGYVESVSVAKVLAHRRRQKIRNNQELIALGAANVASAVTGSMPVAGGFSRSMVNYAAGARTQLAAIITAGLVAVAALFFMPLFYYLPRAALAAVIVVAVAPLLDWKAAVSAWRYDRADAAALLVTFLGVILVDIETGLLLGLAVSVGTFLWRSSRPHVAVVGRVPGTHHFRNVSRYRVETWPELLLLRVDRSLFFANTGHVEDLVAATAAEQPDLRHLVLICSAVNSIDHSALESLEQLAESLREADITLHLAEVKGPTMDRLRRSDLLKHLAPGQVFLSTEEAVETLADSHGPAPEETPA